MEIASEKARYQLIKELGILVNAELIDEFKVLKERIKIDEKRIINTLRKEIDDDAIKANLASIFCISLNLTNQCNFRCGYCVYSGIYKFEREHGNKNLDYETAIGAVEFFLDLINSNNRSRKDNTFTIGFYGGEPLLRFPILKKVIIDAEKLIEEKRLSGKFKIDFRVNTNGYLLTGEIVDFLKSKNAIVDITLDGPASEHDRFRKTREGKKTWNTIIANINALYEKYPGYYRERIYYLCTMHPLHDVSGMAQFFKSKPHLFNIDHIHFSPVDLDNLTPDAGREIDRILKEKERMEFDEDVLTHVLRNDIEGKFFLKDISGQEGFLVKCFPGGTKVFIDSDGKFHICEKINPNFPIGDVKNGFDFEKIRSIMKSYNEEVIKHRCWECDWWFLCGMCFARAAKDNGFIIDCKDIMNSRYSLLRKYLERIEAQNETVDTHFACVADYIDSL